MAKLYEILAVETDLKGKATRILNEVKGLFSEGPGKLLGVVRTYHPNDDEGTRYPPENQKMATTVDEELKRLHEAFGNWVDVAVQKEVTNASTTAELEINGKSYDLPATAWLNLEGRLSELRQAYAAIPTLDPSIPWSFDEGKGVFVSEMRRTNKTEKLTVPVVLYEATTEHPAQVELINKDVVVGEWETTYHAGMLTPAEKRKRLKKLDALLNSVKKARQRANDCEITNIEIADDIFEHINK